MRAIEETNDLRVKSFAGSSGVLLAFDVPRGATQGLLGFAIRRIGGGPSRWLNGMLKFEGTAPRGTDPVATNVAPIQKFRWSDYSVKSNTSYRYRVRPVYGTPGSPDVREGAELSLRTSGAAGGKNIVTFNRAAAASQAFERSFPYIDATMKAEQAMGNTPSLPQEAQVWLSRGLLEQILRFIDSAKGPGWALDIAIYEYELPDIVKAVRRAHRRGVHVRIVYHAKSGDPQTSLNEVNVAGLPAASKRARRTSAIFHDKFIVLSRINGRGEAIAKSVLCGSTNFTENGVYRQANVVHVLKDASLASTYERLFEFLFAGNSVGKTRQWIDRQNVIDDASGSVFVGFSPRSEPDDLAAFASIIDRAKRDVLFCTAFKLDPSVEAALLGQPNDPILRFGLQNTRSSITGFHRDRTARFVASAFLNNGLEGFLKESTAKQRGNILIHTKLVVVDFTSDTPTVISGSHNLGIRASHANDENFLIVRGDADVADCYGVELMRFYDHYRFRWASKQFGSPPKLTVDDSWTERYFRPGLNQMDRLAFAG